MKLDRVGRKNVKVRERVDNLSLERRTRGEQCPR